MSASLPSPSLPDLYEIEDETRALGLGIGASELHGALCGWLAGGGVDSPRWLAQVMADDTVSAPGPGSVLDRLRQASVAQMEDRDFGFDLLVPETDAPLVERSSALFDWCKGFLGGFGLAAGGEPPLSEESAEALGDIAKLATATPQEEGDEEDEAALAEIEEFVRVAALLLHGDCAMGLATGANCTDPSHRTDQPRLSMTTHTGISAKTYARRRRQLMRMAGDDAIVVVPSAPERIRSRDTHFPYRQDSDLWYLTGFAEPDAVLVLIPGRKHGETLLFCRERDPEREGWDGPRVGPEGAVDVLGMDDAYPIDDLDEILPGLLEGRSRVYYHFGRDTEFDLKLIGWLNRVRAQVRMGAQPPHEFLELGHLLDEMRLFKDREEIKLMRRAADISVEAHVAAMRAARPGIHEYELQAELERVFRRHDGEPAYCSIVGAGDNACVLHYRDNRAAAKDGALVLVDAGAEYRGYAADITRTFPVNGRFTKEQRALHDLVGDAQRAALAQARPGVPYEAGHNAAVETLTEGLLRLGLLKGSLEKNLASGDYKRFYRHKTGHWLGLDVHDVGEYRIDGESRLLEPDMVFTIEPGLYIGADDTSVHEKWRGIGIRTEDDVVITKDGHDVLTDALARSADEIEALMAER